MEIAGIMAGSILSGLITLFLILAIPIAIWVFITKKIIDYAAKRFAEELAKQMRQKQW